MLKGFEDYTRKLTASELQTVEYIADILRQHIGKASAIKGAAICSEVSLRFDMKFSEPRLRKVVHHITVQDIVPLLCATSQGYFVASDMKDAAEYLESLKGRVAAITAKQSAIERQMQEYDLKRFDDCRKFVQCELWAR